VHVVSVKVIGLGASKKGFDALVQFELGYVVTVMIVRASGGVMGVKVVQLNAASDGSFKHAVDTFRQMY
jgi:hypothetical protein